MDSLFEFLALIVVLFTMVVPAILLIYFKTLKKENRSLEAGNNSHRDELRGIVWRVYALEKALQSIGHEPRVAQPVVTEIPCNGSVAKTEPVPINQQKPEERLAAPSTLAAPLSTAPQMTRPPPREAATQADLVRSKYHRACSACRTNDRGAATAYDFMQDLAGRLANRIQLTTDGHRVYADAVESAFGSNVDYAMLVKLYGPVIPSPGLQLAR